VPLGICSALRTENCRHCISLEIDARPADAGNRNRPDNNRNVCQFGSQGHIAARTAHTQATRRKRGCSRDSSGIRSSIQHFSQFPPNTAQMMHFHRFPGRYCEEDRRRLTYRGTKTVPFCASKKLESCCFLVVWFYPWHRNVTSETPIVHSVLGHSALIRRKCFSTTHGRASSGTGPPYPSQTTDRS